MGEGHWQSGEPGSDQAATPVQAADGVAIAVEPVGERWLVLHVTGEVDMLTAPVLAEQIDYQVGDDGVSAGRALIFDLTGVGFLGSAGLAVLAEASKRASDQSLPKVRVVAGSRAVLRPIEVTGLDSVLDIHGDLASAINAPAES
ncbi:MAG TPA: STAS domain-containing protein [Pseudonocardiaceae bacterium]|nr:STAS domain-containing protein [Pseudonocardiaceae bacterium]